jgi:hypothetical protein
MYNNTILKYVSIDIYIGGSLREPPVEMFSIGGSQGIACGISPFLLASSAGGAGKRQ